jgi:hypothetical protein
MVTIIRRYGPLQRRIVWFSRDPDFDGKTTYYQSFLEGSPRGYTTEQWTTLVVNLDASDDELLTGMRKTTRNEVRQMIRKGPEIDFGVSIPDFLAVYNAFARSKNGVVPLSEQNVDVFGDCLQLTGVTVGATLLVVHAYFVDIEEQRTRLLFSATTTGNLPEGMSKNELAKCNRYLHFMDMRFFRDQGCVAYDFGGYAINSSDPVKLSIAKFKAGFGGTEEVFWHHKPWWFAALHGIKKR